VRAITLAGSLKGRRSPLSASSFAATQVWRAAYLGHASIQTTFDRYGHLMAGNENEAVALVDAYLAGADTRRPVDALGS
jgi:integrase